jgi:hypothetical protein
MTDRPPAEAPVEATIERIEVVLANLIITLSQGSTPDIENEANFLINIGCTHEPTSRVFQVASVGIHSLIGPFPDCPAIIRAFAAFSLLRMDLPVSFDRDELFEIPNEFSDKFTAAFREPSITPIAIAFIVAASFPSARVIGDIPNVNGSLLPDVMDLVEDRSKFDDNELAVATRALCRAHQLVQEIGANSERVTLSQIVGLQRLLVANYNSLSALYWSLTMHVSRSSSISIVIRFLSALKSPVGVELLREMMTLNVCPSFVKFMKLCKLVVHRTLFVQRESLPPSFMFAASVFSTDWDNLSAVLASQPTNDLAYQHTVCFALLKMSFEPISTFWRLIVSYWHSITNHVRSIVNVLAVKPCLVNPVYDQFAVGILGLLYEQSNRFKIQQFSSHFFRDTASVLTFLAHVPLIEKSFLFYAVQRAYKSVAQTVRQTPGFANCSQYFLPSDCIGAGIIASLIQIDMPTIVFIARCLIEPSTRRTFLIALRMCLNSLVIPAFANRLFDLYLDVITEGPSCSRVGRIINLHLLLSEVFSASPEFALQFLHIQGSEVVTSFVYGIFREANKALVRSRVVILEPLLYFVTRLFRVVPTSEIAPPPLESLFAMVSSLRTSILSALCECAIAVGQRIGHFPYTVNWDACRRLGLVELVRYFERSGELGVPPDVERPTPGLLPWYDWGVESLAFVPREAVVVVQTPQAVPRSQIIFAVDDGE